jgi:16S rRNA (cytosine1402-N4)-methyltransferase
MTTDIPHTRHGESNSRRPAGFGQVTANFSGRHHIPVLCREVSVGLGVQAGDIVVDGTLGGGGHTRQFLHEVAPGGRVIALDRDPGAVERAKLELSGLPTTVVQANFADLRAVLDELGVTWADVVFVDLGFSSDQLADASRGISFMSDGPLDMRFDRTQGKTAADLVQRLSERELADLIYRYGEERQSRRIARGIVTARRREPIKSTRQLADIVRDSMRIRRGGRIDPATRTFQALRIAVNDELQSLEALLSAIPQCLRVGGRAGIISFHSLEDRLVKNAFKARDVFDIITRKPIRPSQDEAAVNPRARSAKLRIAQVCPEPGEPSSTSTC